MKQSQGSVFFVGAGPGPADLLTVRAERLLRSADLVAYDELVEPELLALTRPDCELLSIGYRARSKGSQHPILHERILEVARSGAQVVRLKSGDPLIFGRAAEEMAMLDAAGISYEIIPGITAALAAAAAGAWPLTQKGKACSLRMMTWSLDFAPPSPAETLAIYMPKHGLKQMIDELVEQGWCETMPAAYIQSALRSDQAITEASLGTLHAIVEQHCDARPGICLIGSILDRRIEPLLSQVLQGKVSSYGSDSGLHRIG
jgi:uroporphyrin-III C-methyltransferase